MQIVSTSAGNLASALSTHAVELIFTRRIIPPRKKRVLGLPAANTRRMFATNCRPLLNELRGMKILNFENAKPTKIMFEGGLRYNPRVKNLVCAFDLFRLEYRMISAESCGIITMEESDFAKNVLDELFMEREQANALDSTATEEEYELQHAGINALGKSVWAKMPLKDKKYFTDLIHYNQLKRQQESVVAGYETRKTYLSGKDKRRPVLQLPMPLTTEEERNLFWLYWAHNIQPKMSEVNWRLQFENK